MYVICYDCMRFVVSDHAKFRIMERGIDVDLAKQVIKAPDTDIIQKDGSRVATKKVAGDRNLTIVYKQKSSTQVIIITGYYES